MGESRADRSKGGRREGLSLGAGRLLLMGSEGLRRGVATDAFQPFRGETPEQRIAEAIRIGEACLDVYLAALPPGTTREEARARAARMKGLGRRRSDASLS